MRSGARSPTAEQQAKVGTIDDAVAVEVRNARSFAAGTPSTEHQTEVGAIHEAVIVDVANQGSGASIVRLACIPSDSQWLEMLQK